MAVIPGRNINAYSPDEFTLDVIEDMYFTAELTARTTTLASPVSLFPKYVHQRSLQSGVPGRVNGRWPRNYLVDA